MSRPLILNVDDYEAGRYARTRWLRAWGFEVKEAGTGAEALRLAKLEAPALVILDIRLPDMDGFEVCRRLKREHDGATLPVLHVSATFTSGAHQALGLEGGADGYLVEPVEPVVLRATVDALLRVRRAERALHTAARQWEATFDGIGDGIAMLAPDLRIVRCNVAFTRMFGVSAPSREPVSALWDTADAVPPFVRVWKTVQREIGDVSRGGRWFRLTVDPVVEDGVTVNAVCFASEVTETRRLEHERETRFASAHQARADAEAANRAKDDFLAVLGHELRTPLMPIALAMRALQRTHPDDPAIVRAQDIVERQVHHLTRLVDDLLDVARLTRRKLQLHVERVDLSTVVRDAVEAARSHVDARRHRLAVHVPSAPVWVKGDAVRFGQIVVNLLANAAKFTPAEGEIAVTLERGANDAVIRVRDSGIGIDVDSLPLIFEPFAQGPQVPGASERGLGIGLALVQGLAEAHGGSVTVSSDGPGRGSEFTVRLPLGPSADFIPDAPRPTAAGTGTKILIVEDHADSRAMLAEMLAFEGYEVTAVADGAEALEKARVSPPDVAVVDIGLRRMDGHDVARRLRAAHGEAIRLIAVTGYGQAEDIEQSRAAGFDAHVTKPVDVDALLRILPSRPRR
jgi:signal transduction histidine kinase